jgi:hypothetical protein
MLKIEVYNQSRILSLENEHFSALIIWAFDIVMLSFIFECDSSVIPLSDNSK